MDDDEEEHHAIFFIYDKLIKQMENNMLQKRNDLFPKQSLMRAEYYLGGKIDIAVVTNV